MNDKNLYVENDKLYQVKINELNLMNNKNFEGVFDILSRNDNENQIKLLKENNFLNKILSFSDENIVICYGKDIRKAEIRLLEEYKCNCLWQIENYKHKLETLKQLEEDIKIENMGNE